MAASPPFRLKGSLVTLSILKPLSTDLSAIDAGLTTKVAQAPALFDRAPLLLDLAGLPDASALDLPGLRALVAKLGFVPVAVRGGGEAVATVAAAMGLGVLGDGRLPADVEPAPPPAQDPAPAPAITANDGAAAQAEAATDADLIVLAGVSPGSELLADGHIHVYGPLRGLALAGLRGNTQARIYCRALEAELIAVAGCFQVAEDIDPALHGRPAQVFLDGEDLVTALL